MMKRNILYLLSVSFIYFTYAAQPFLTILIPSYNNKSYVIDTLESIRRQTYQNYRIIYIDDCSTDGSFTVVQNYINQHGWHDKMIAIQNPVRQRKLRNIYYALHYLCSDDDIVVFIDCDDRLAHTRALERVANIMSNDSVWFMYGNDKAFPEQEARHWGVSTGHLCAPTDAETIRKNDFRNKGWIYMHIRAFRAWLYKNIQLRDLLVLNVPGFKGKFYPQCDDYANIYPMLEMAGSHLFFNDQLVYLYNAGSPINGFKIERTLQVQSATEVKGRQRYQPLRSPVRREKSEPIVSVLLTTEDNQAHFTNNLHLKENSQSTLFNMITTQEEAQSVAHALAHLTDEYVVIVHRNALQKTISPDMLEQALIDLKKAQAEWIHLCTHDQIPASLTTQYIKDDLVVYGGWINTPITTAHAHICKKSVANQLMHILTTGQAINNQYLAMISIIDANV